MLIRLLERPNQTVHCKTKLMKLKKYRLEKLNDHLDQELSLHLTYHRKKHVIHHQNGEDPAVNYFSPISKC